MIPQLKRQMLCRGEMAWLMTRTTRLYWQKAPGRLPLYLKYIDTITAVKTAKPLSERRFLKMESPRIF
ncbi:hypothetical protein ABIE50_003519 [Chitinophaga sp. OAE865]